MSWQALALEQAMRALRAGGAPAAQRIAQDLIRRDPRCADGWFFLARLAQQSNHILKARGLAETALRVAPDSTRYLAFHAFLLAICQEYPDALALVDALETRTDKEIGRAHV